MSRDDNVRGVPILPDDETKVGGDITQLPMVGVQLRATTDTRKWWIVTAGIFTLIAIGLVAFFMVVLPRMTAKPQPTGISAATHFVSPQALVDQITPELTGKMMDVQTVSGLGGLTAKGYVAFSPPAYSPSGVKFAAMPTESVGVALQSGALIAEENYADLTNFFVHNKFKQVQDRKGPAYVTSTEKAMTVHYAAYESNEILCAVWHADASQTSLKDHVASMGCASKASYKMAAEQLKPFYAAYTKDADQPKSDLVFGDAVINDGGDGYKNATVYQEDQSQGGDDDGATLFFRVLYYKSPASKEWTAFTGIRGGTPECSMYSNDILKTAFKGYECYDEVKKEYKKV